jgi:predicted  nucleic acid-binding Zn-ribbon protein
VEEIRSLEDLLDLQGLDSGIDRLLDRRTHLPALAAYRVVHRRLERLDTDIAAAAAAKRELDLAEDRAEGEMKLDEVKVQREEQRLYAGGLSAKDTTHLRDEVQMLRDRISRREDEALALIEQQQATAAALEALEAERGAVAADGERLDGEISAEWKVIDAEIARLEAAKRAAVLLIDPDLLALYEEIRPSKEGIAAAPMVDGTCGGCHLRLSAAEQVQMHRAFPPRCLHCRRILVSR